MRDAKIGLTSIAPSHGVWSVLAIVNLGREKGSTSYLCIVLGVSDCVSAFRQDLNSIDSVMPDQLVALRDGNDARQPQQAGEKSRP